MTRDRVRSFLVGAPFLQVSDVQECFDLPVADGALVYVNSMDYHGVLTVSQAYAVWDWVEDEDQIAEPLRACILSGAGWWRLGVDARQVDEQLGEDGDVLLRWDGEQWSMWQPAEPTGVTPQVLTWEEVRDGEVE